VDVSQTDPKFLGTNLSNPYIQIKKKNAHQTISNATAKLADPIELAVVRPSPGSYNR
jgi:hypothetical protein